MVLAHNRNFCNDEKVEISGRVALNTPEEKINNLQRLRDR